MHDDLTSVSDYICNGLFSINKDGFRTKRMAKVIWKTSKLKKKTLSTQRSSCVSDGESKDG